MTLQQSGGRKLATVGNYRFTGKRLGKGNFAKVEEAAHALLNIKVAIKIMDVSTIKEEYVIRNLYREAKIMSRLSHPCIAALFQTMQHGNMYYLVTELVAGGDLCNFIKGQRNGRLEEHYTRVFARQLISAISHMHNLGIVHRDLKMENVMLNMLNDRIKIVDFGLSNIYTNDSPLRTHCGSPEYAAPELFVEGKHYGPEVDLWSLGVILYGMVVGQLPFVSTSRDGAVTSHQQRRKRLLEQINKGLSTTHRKALALFSTEFKAMMAKLLVADSSKRINIAELIFHPWVTEKGRKSIRSNPIKKLDEHTQITVAKDVAALTNLDWLDVQHAIKTEIHGNIAGIYNLIVHQHQESLLGHDPITGKTLVPHYTPRPSSGLNPDSPKPLLIKSPVKRQTFLKSAPTQRVSKASHIIDVKTKTCECAAPKVKPRVQSSKPAVITKENVYNFVPLRRVISRKSNSHCLDENPMKVKAEFSTPNRKEHAEKKPQPSPHFTSNLAKAPAGDATYKSPNYNHYDNLIYKMEAKIKQSKVNEKPSSRSLRTHSGDVTLEGKSPQVGQIRRPLTTGPIHTAERAAKRRSMLPVMTGKRMPRGVASAGPTATTTPKPVRVVSDKRQDKVEECRRHVISPVKCFSSNKIRDFSNEPIARSIAGYVTKNISNNLEPVSMMIKRRGRCDEG